MKKSNETPQPNISFIQGVTLAVVVQVSDRTYEAKTQEIAKQLLEATREKRSFFAQVRDQMR
ncbi:MAG TPA: hypothetical protein V6D50_03245, partial [Chroococcales cyanobacterium]